MARLPRLAVAGQAHLVLMLGHSAQPVFVDDDDRRLFLAALRDAARQHGVAVHAYALQPSQVLLLLTPGTAGALGALMQGLGRRYGAAFNRRHGRRGSLWAGRFRTAVVQAGAPLLEAMLYIDLQGVAHDAGTGLDAVAAGGPAGRVELGQGVGVGSLAGVVAGASAASGSRSGADAAAWCSLGHHLGQRRDPLITDGTAWWALGNTPFEREAAYRRCLAEGLAPSRAAALAHAAHQGWAVGDAGFLAALALQADRPVQPRPRGRPPRPA